VLGFRISCSCVCVFVREDCCSCPLPVAAMTAADSAPAVDPAPAPEAVDEAKVDEKPAKVTKEKKAKAPKEKKATKAAKSPKAAKAPAAHPPYQVVSSISLHWWRKTVYRPPLMSSGVPVCRHLC
jgi:hypothetical protein